MSVTARTRWVRVVVMCGIAARGAAPLFAQDAASATRLVDTTTIEPVAAAQRQPPRQSREPATSGFLFFDVAWHHFTANQSFDAIFGSSTGMMYGGGLRVAHRSGVFGQFGVFRFKDTGERVFASPTLGAFPLGISTTITVIPFDFTGGYQFKIGGPPSQPGRVPATAARRPPIRRLRPYVGGGIGFVNYKEEGAFAAEGDDVSDRFFSYHVSGGMIVQLARQFGVGADVIKRWVPNALGDNGVSQAFNETDLGGVAFAIRFTIGS